MLVDISGRKRAEEHQQMLVRELHHRVKNTLATVQAIMGSTARAAETVEAFREAMIGRIGSLARTHLLLSEEGASVAFADVLHNELDAFDDGSEDRIRLHGPDGRDRRAAGGVARHGDPRAHPQCGQIRRAVGPWRQSGRALACDRQGRARRTLTFDWVECGGPQVKPPARQGFGSRLLDFVLPGQIQAKSRIDYRAQGVRVHCVVPLTGEAQTG